MDSSKDLEAIRDAMRDAVKRSRERIAHVPLPAVEPIVISNNAPDGIQGCVEKFIDELAARDAALEAMAQECERLAAAQVTADAANQAKSLFLANMTHELRTPLNAIIGYGEILNEDLSEAELSGQSADCLRILGAGRHLLKLVEQVLDFARMDSLDYEVRPSSLNVRALLQEIQESNRIAASRNANSLEVHVASDAERCFSDSNALLPCLQALVSNAIKFTKSGQIRIEATRHELGAQPMLQITVADTGIGMSPKQLAALFEPFSPADAAVTIEFGGIGLGLVNARKQAKLLGGDIEVTSELGRGSVFTVRIPQTYGVVESAELAPALLEAASKGPYVLVVDDRDEAGAETETLQAELGMGVVRVDRGGDALALAHRAPPALVILDVRLADSSGWIVLEKLKSELSGAPVIVTTRDEDRNRSAELGAALHLTKPVDRRALLAAARRLLRRGAAQ